MSGTADDESQVILTQYQIQTFLNDGVLVVDNILTPDQVAAAQSGLSKTLARVASVDTADLANSGHGLSQLSSTNGSGGVLDIFYDDWKFEIATNRRLFSVTSLLWKAAYCHDGERKEDLPQEEIFRWHPYGKVDCDKGYCYIDRIGYRVPTKIAEKLGAEISETTTTNKKKNAKPIQRSLTPHLDCCPENLFGDKTKWRPIQCFVSLSDTMEPGMGGFECAKGFHRDFHQWASNRPPTVQRTKKKQQIRGKLVVTEQEVSFPAPCIGEYTHIRPKEDRQVMERIEHIPVKAGQAVFWDSRLPHANAYRHDGGCPRCVVYCSFLPDVAVNREYARRQLWKWQHGQNPNDQWIHKERVVAEEPASEMPNNAPWLTPLARRLLYLDSW